MNETEPQSGIQLTGDGAVAAGEGAKAVGQGGVLIEGDSNAPINVFTAEARYATLGLENPFLGLRAFSYADRARYAGRERLVQATVERITQPGAQQTLTFVTGASGSGKSSFAQAGLIPALEAHYRSIGLEPRWAVMRPGKYPMAALAEAIRALGLPIDDTFSPVRPFMVGVPAEPPPPNAIALLVIDQFEELFRAESSQRAAMVAILSALPPFATLRGHAIATMRSDYLSELFQRKALYDIAKQGIDLRAMTEDELKDAIQRPVQSAHPQLRFEPELLDKLAHDAAQDETYLPLLQVTLDDIWRKGGLRLANYRTLTDAIRQRAESVYGFKDYDGGQREPRSDADKQAVLDIMLDLVEVSLDDDPRKDVRRRLSATTLVRGSAQRKELVDDLTRARLLSKSFEPTAVDPTDANAEVVDIIHESFILNWTRLGEEVARKRATLRQRTRFLYALRDWQNDPRRLLSDIDLAEAESLDAAGDVALRDDVAQQFLKLSLAEREKQRNAELMQVRELAETRRRALKRTRIFSLALVGLGVLLFAVGMFALSAYRQFLATTLTQSLIAQSSKFIGTNTDTALLLGVEAARRQAESNPEASLSLGANPNLLEVNQCCSDQLLGVMHGHEDRVWSVAYSPVQTSVLASSSDDGRVLIWDVAKRSLLATLTDTESMRASVYSVAFSPNGDTLLSGNGEGSVVAWRTSNWQRIGATKAHSANVHSLAFSPDGTKFVSGGADGRVVVWDTASRQPITANQLHSNWVWSVAFAPDGQSVASAGRDNLIWLWDFGADAVAPTRTLSLTNHNSVVTSIAMNRDTASPRMVSGDSAGNVIVWDLSGWQSEHSRPTASRRMDVANGIVWGLALSPNGESLITGSGSGRVKRRAMPAATTPVSAVTSLEAQSLAILASPNGIFRIAVSPDGTAFAAGGLDGRVTLWSMAEPSSHVRLAGHAVSVAASGQNEVTAVGMDDENRQPYVLSRVWRSDRSFSDAKQVLTTTPASLSVLSSDGALVATTHNDGRIRVWQRKSGALSLTLDAGDLMTVTALAFSVATPSVSQNRAGVLTAGPITRLAPAVNPPVLLAAGDANGAISVWRTDTGARVAHILGNDKGRVYDLAFSPNRQWLVAGGCSTIIRTQRTATCGRGGARVWRVSELNQPPLLIPGKSGFVRSLAIGPDNDTLAMGSDDDTIGIWRLSDPDQLLFTLTGHESGVGALAISPDGSLLASGDDNWHVIVWSLANGARLGNAFVEHDFGMTALAFSPDGRYLFSANTDQTVVRHDLDTQALTQRACRLAGRDLTEVEWARYLPGEPYRKTCSPQ